MMNGPRISTSPSSASLISAPGDGGPDRADLDLVRRVAGAVAAGLGHAPQLGQRDADRVEELDHLAAAWAPRPRSPTRPGRARAARGSSRAPARPPSRARGSSSGTSSPACSAAPSAGPRRAPTAVGLLLRGVLLGLDAGLDRGLELLPDARHGEEPGRPHLGQVGHHLARVRAAGGGEAEQHRQVVASRRARRCAPSAARRSTRPVVRERDHLVEAAEPRPRGWRG